MTTFQPTLPARGATVILDVIIRVPYFNPRSPHGERPDIRTSHGKKGNFNPRSPHGERQKPPTERGKNYDISTHAPRTGSDSKGARFSLQKNHFNPRSPHGERPQTDDNGISGDIFQPTLPARGATDAKEENSGFFLTISTHAPRTGSDIFCAVWMLEANHFNPRSPHGERHRFVQRCIQRLYFNPRSPHGERPQRPPQPRRRCDFNPRSPHGERRCASVKPKMR